MFRELLRGVDFCHLLQLRCCRVNLAIESRSSHTRKAAKGGGLGKNADFKRSMGTGHGFSARNSHGKRAEGDKRQFARI